MGDYRLDLVSAGLLAGIGITFLVRRSAPSLPLPFMLLRRFAAIYLAIVKSFHAVNSGYIPVAGPVIFVANHTTAYDPVCLQVACKNRCIRFMEAREFYDKKALNFIYRALRVIPVNRTGNDTASIRTAVRELSNNGCIGIFPEGRISDDGQIHEARKGVALLALMSNAVVVPAYCRGTRPYSGMIADFLLFDRVTLHFGPPIRFDDLAGQHGDKEIREIALKRVMDGIIALRDNVDPQSASRRLVGHDDTQLQHY